MIGFVWLGDDRAPKPLPEPVGEVFPPSNTWLPCPSAPAGAATGLPVSMVDVIEVEVQHENDEESPAPSPSGELDMGERTLVPVFCIVATVLFAITADNLYFGVTGSHNSVVLVAYAID